MRIYGSNIKTETRKWGLTEDMFIIHPGAYISPSNYIYIGQPDPSFFHIFPDMFPDNRMYLALIFSHNRLQLIYVTPYISPWKKD